MTNMADYIDNQECMDLLAFFYDRQHLFPNFFILAQCNAPWQVAEVGCARFFGLAGYILASRHTRWE
jgi:hypothetical protein